MKSLWDSSLASKLSTPLELRVYTSRLLGQEPSLVLHGGGNTSVKDTVENLFGEKEDILFVKGSGWDLATIEAEGFAPVKMDVLLKMAEMPSLSDSDMVKYQRAAMTNPSAPNPSVEAILHAIIPFKYVDHTHADVIVTMTNTPTGEARIEELFGKNMLIIPYIMPGFVLARLVYEMTQDIDWQSLDGMVLMNHGLFTFDDDAKRSYEKTIELVTKAEEYLATSAASISYEAGEVELDLHTMAAIRMEVSEHKGASTIAHFNTSVEAETFSRQDIESIGVRGPLTPDHVIRTKRIPAIIKPGSVSESLNSYVEQYKAYFADYAQDEVCLNPAPGYGVIPGFGSVSFGKALKEALIIKDINQHTFKSIMTAEALDSYQALPAKDIFDVEYWELEQAKLKKGGKPAELAGKVAVVINGGTALGDASVAALKAKGAEVVTFDPALQSSEQAVEEFFGSLISTYGGVDILVQLFNTDGLFAFYQKLLEFFPYSMDPVVVNVQVEDEDLSLFVDPSAARFNSILTGDFDEPNAVASMVAAMAGEQFKHCREQVVVIG